MINRQECLIFYHIPKTAGMTFTDILEKEYGKEHSFHLRRADHKLGDIEKYKSLTTEEKKNINMITGHLSHILESEVPHKVRYVTFLRDPLSQFISSYNYIVQTPHNTHHEEVTKLSGIEEYLEWQIRTKRDSIYARYLGDANKYYQKQHNVKIDVQKPNEGKKLYNKAVKRLRSMDFVFITEEFDEAILTLHKALGWPQIPYYRRKNTSERQHMANEELIKKIKNANKYDFMLYDEAKKMHRELVKQTLGINAKWKVKGFQTLNKLRSRGREVLKT